VGHPGGRWRPSAGNADTGYGRLLYRRQIFLDFASRSLRHCMIMVTRNLMHDSVLAPFSQRVIFFFVGLSHYHRRFHLQHLDQSVFLI
jgi:hypothetical protein